MYQNEWLTDGGGCAIVGVDVRLSAIFGLECLLRILEAGRCKIEIQTNVSK